MPNSSRDKDEDAYRRIEGEKKEAILAPWSWDTSWKGKDIKKECEVTKWDEPHTQETSAL